MESSASKIFKTSKSFAKKKKFLIKYRTTSSIVEIAVAFFIPILGLIGYKSGRNNFLDSPSPQMIPVDFQDMKNWFFIPILGLLEYVNSIKELKQYINSNDKNNVDFEWANIDETNALTNPSINVYVRSQSGYPDLGIYFQIRNSLVKMRTLEEGIQMEFMNISFYEGEFAHPLITQRMKDLGFSNAMLSAISVILITMSDIELIFVEKDSKITELSFLMGMSELTYWFSNFIVSLIFALFIYCSCLYAFVFGLNGNNFGVIFVFTILFSIAEIWFQFFLTTLINNLNRRKILPILLIMIAITLPFFFQFVTLKERSDASMALNNIFCLFPLSAYEIFIIQGYIANVTDLPLYKFSDLNNIIRNPR